jgi:uncharacterized protein involved in response to NO
MRPINLLEPIEHDHRWYALHRYAVFNLGFRPLFLSASVWALFGMVVWVSILSGWLPWRAEFPATLWHAHEMIFAFAGAVAVGFLFTASQNWTGVTTLNGAPLLALTAIWVCARITFVLFPDSVGLVLLGQTAFWLVAIAHFSWVLFSNRSRNNYVFIYVLCGIATANMSFLILVLFGAYHLAGLFSQAAMLMFTLLIGLVGGRVIPFFTARGLNIEQVKANPAWDKALLVISIIGLAGFIASQMFGAPLNPGYAIALAASLHLIRLGRWWNNQVLKVPLLWSMHLAYGFTSLGLMWFALCFLFATGQQKDALHLITVGGVGLMILAMMARVSLGHTSRPLKTHVLTNVAFILCLVAALIRALGPLVIFPHLSWQISGGVWTLAFICFVFVYWPILTRPRVDGRRG